MAPMDKKRKNAPAHESFVRAKQSLDGDDRPSKKRRPDSKEGKFAALQKIPLVPKISRGFEGDGAFPRGGASILTPLEHKQIQNEAARDVVFEQQSSKSSGLDLESAEADAIWPVKKTSKFKGKDKKITENIGAEDGRVKIEGLSYKRIVPGSLILGQVAQINAHDIALSLPNNLTGYVPITSISDSITQRIEAIAAAGEEVDDDDGNDAEEETAEVELSKIFSLGQYLRAYVVSAAQDPINNTSGKAKRRIELSLRPQQVNNALTSRNIIIHSTLMASVASVEDHGLIMDLGLQDPEMRGFVSSKEIAHEVAVSSIQEGSVFLCMVTGLSSSGKTVKLCPDLQRLGNLRKLNHLTEAPTVDAFLPGTAVEILISDLTSRGIAGKVMGIVNVTADLMHSGAGASGENLEKKYKIGTKIKGRIICSFPTVDPPKLGVSLLDHIMSFSSHVGIMNGEMRNPLEILPLSAIIEEVIVRQVEPGIGLFVEIGIKGVAGFVHISRIKDKKIESLSESTGPYKLGSIHRGRLIGYNRLDGVYLVSLEQRTLEQPFLRVEDLKVGEVVKGKVETIVVNEVGVGGLLVNLADGITGLVPEMHMADVQLLHPEKKFKEGMSVTARVLSTDLDKCKIRLTLKKSLVNSEAVPFVGYNEISIGMHSPGTIVNILQAGAVVQFYGTVRGFLPVSEMSEAFITNPSQHFRIGQVVNVHVLKVNPEAKKLTVSCKDPSAFGLDQQHALKSLKIGDILSAMVTEKSSDDISVELQGLGLRAVLPVGHLTDGSEQRNLSALKKVRVGQTLTDLVVLEKLEQKHLVILTNKLSLVKDAKNHSLLRSFEDVKENTIVHGFVKNVTLTAIFVQFGGGVTGLLPKTKLPADAILLPDFGMRKLQSVKVKVISVDHGQRRFVLSMTDVSAGKPPQEPEAASVSVTQATVNPVDDTITCVDDFTVGKLTKARISSVKETQINVQLADNVQGRIDVSQVFDSWEEIKNRKRPLYSFWAKQVVDVRVLGIHDARNHRFLPISHRAGKTLVYELSAKPSDQTENSQEPLTLDKVNPSSSWIAFVNNIEEECLWVNLSPNVRGRIRVLDVSDDVSLLQDLESNFPIGSAIRVRVINVDIINNRLDLSARSGQSSGILTFSGLSKGMVVPGRVTRANERQIMVQLSDDTSGPVHLTDLADDFSEANPTKYSKNDIVRVCVIDVDALNRRVCLSTRPSRVLNSSLAVKDPEITSISQLKVNDVLRGFVKNVSDRGLFVNLGGNITAYARVSDLSDSYIKDWKSEFPVDLLVRGKITAVDPLLNHVQISLKSSVVDKVYVAPLNFSDIQVGQIITGKIRKVEAFGVFIVIDRSKNVSGLCHHSEMADNRVHDVKRLYEEGDRVKAIVLKLDLEKKRISFGLKASYFENGDTSEEESNNEDLSGMQGVRLRGSSGEQKHPNVHEDDDADLHDIESIQSISEKDTGQSHEVEMGATGSDAAVDTLNAGEFDWSAGILDDIKGFSNIGSEDGNDDEKPKKKRRKKADIKIDRTGDLDAHGPQSVSDFERLLLGQPDSSQLWIQYMAFQMQLSELSKAREVAERAIQTINIREETEKMNVWIALLNLENAYGSDDTVEGIFKRACQYNDAQEIHERLISIYIQCGKLDKADNLFQVLIKKFPKTPMVWYNYAHFLQTTLAAPDRARALLPRATQSLPPHTHLNLILKFAALEFHAKSGSPERGRTMFEGLVSTFPKRLDIWNQLLDLEIQQGDQDLIRGVFERVIKTKGLKPKGAKAWFRRWSEWEDKNGDTKSQERVKTKAGEWVRVAAEKKAIGEETVG